MNQTLAGKTILFIGAGAMAEAIIRGLVSLPGSNPERIIATNSSNRDRLTILCQKYGIRTGSGPEAVRRYTAEADIIVLAMKPKDAGAALEDLAPLVHPGQLVISVIAGLSIDTMENRLGRLIPIARCMPNTSCTIG